MRKRLVAVGAAVVMLVLTMTADEKPTEAYQKAMQENQAALKVARAAIKEIEDAGADVPDYLPFAEVAARMKTSFAVTVAYWQARKVDDALQLARDGEKHVADLETAAKERDYRMVVDSLTSLNDTCTACHMAHRARLADDGPFAIK
jgi:hypothetical protein